LHDHHVFTCDAATGSGTLTHAYRASARFGLESGCVS
jgi:hypothetical protein